MHICRCFSKTGRMRFSRFFSDMPVIVLLAFFSFALASCNKEEEEEVSDMMIGDLLYDVPLYVKIGSTVELTAYGLTEPDESLINYVWTSEYLLQDTVREKVCEITVPDSIGTFALILTASDPLHFFEKTSDAADRAPQQGDYRCSPSRCACTLFFLRAGRGGPCAPAAPQSQRCLFARRSRTCRGADTTAKVAR